MGRASDDKLLDYLNLSKTREQIENNDLDDCGEYIEPHCDDLLDETIEESIPEQIDEESNDVDSVKPPVRKSKREPKPKKMDIVDSVSKAKTSNTKVKQS